MDLTYPPEAEEFRGVIATWLEENLPDGWGTPEFVMTPEQRAAFSTEWTAKLFAGGWICASWPVEYGGKGLTLLQQVVLNEEFARVGAPLRGDFFGDTLVGPTLLQWGTEEQKKEFIPSILSGEIAWCQGFSEPDAGSDLASLKTRAALDGDEWVINGQKVWTTQAQYADYMFLAGAHRSRGAQARRHLLSARPHASARHRGAADPADRRLRRIQRGLLDQRALPEGQRGRWPEQRVEGGDDDARLRARHLGHDRLPAVPQGIQRDPPAGAGRRGRQNPLIRQRLALAWSKIKIMEINGYRTLTDAVNGTHTTAALSACNKMFWSETHQETLLLGMDILGMRGQTLLGQEGQETLLPGARRASANYPVDNLQSLFFFSRSETIWGGAAEIQRNIVGERVLGLPKEPRP